MEDKYHQLSNNARVKKVKSGRFTITPVDPTGTLNTLGPFLRTSQVFLENGRFNIIKGPEQKRKSSVKYHTIPKGASIKEIKSGRLTITPVDQLLGSLTGPVSNKSSVTYKLGRLTIKKGPTGKRFNSIGGRKTYSSKRRSRRVKRRIV
jgi:hypothetical protein